MNARTRIVCFLILVFSSPVYGQPRAISDPVQHYAEHSLGDLKTKLTGWDERADWERPETSYLFRFSLDVLGDNEPELFVGSSALNRWHVYRQLGGGRYDRVSDHQLWLGHDNRLGYRKNGKDGLILFRKTGHSWEKYVVESYRFSERGSVKREVVDFAEPLLKRGEKPLEFDEVLRMLEPDKMVELSIEKVLLKKYLADPRAEWRPLNRAYSRLQQHLDPVDASDLAAIAAQETWQTRIRGNWRAWGFNAGLTTLLILGILSLVPWKLERRRNRWTLLLPVLAAGVYGLNELLVPNRMIRADLILVYPLLAVIGIMGAVRWTLFLWSWRNRTDNERSEVVKSNRTVQLASIALLLCIIVAVILYLRWDAQERSDCMAKALKPGMSMEEIKRANQDCKFFTNQISQ